jgi:Uma2 family endonuclease
MAAQTHFEKLMIAADAIGVRLEIIAGLPVWETSPVYRHQAEVDRIRTSVKAVEGSTCACHHIADTVFAFPDGSLKRPDIAILCRIPNEEEMDSALTQIPAAVVEIISLGYEEKDLKLAPNFYLAQGVKDVLIFDPRAKLIWHHRVDGVKSLSVPQEFKLECGCTLRI